MGDEDNGRTQGNSTLGADMGDDRRGERVLEEKEGDLGPSRQ